MDRCDKTDEFLSAMEEKIDKIIRKKKRLYFDVNDNNLHEVVKYIFVEMGCRLSTATAAETFNGLEVLYQFSHDPSGCYFCPRVVLTDKKHPEMNSIAPIVKGAEWIEREMFELWGITFTGHPRPEPLLTGNHPKGVKIPLRFGRIS